MNRSPDILPGRARGAAPGTAPGAGDSEAPDRARPIAVFLADTSPDVAAQVQAWAQGSDGFLRVQGFTNAGELTRRLAYQQPDLLLLDVTLPRFDGLTAIRALKADRIPVVLLSPDTVEGARIAMQALLDGASDFLVKRQRGGAMHLAISRARFFCGIRRLLGTHWAAEVAPCLGERRLRGLRLVTDAAGESLGGGAGDAEGWLRLDANTGGLRVRGREEPWGAEGGGCCVALATARVLQRMAQGLTPALEHLAGPAHLFVPLSRHFARGLREVLSRRWNRTVLELQAGERPHPGQWRLAPGRTLLCPIGVPEGIAFELRANRIVDDGRTTGRQLRLLQAAPPGRLRILLAERPGGAMLDPLIELLQAGHAVYLHAGALATPEPAGAGTWLEGPGEWVGHPDEMLPRAA
jgi:CheY-like chemotaxis protein